MAMTVNGICIFHGSHICELVFAKFFSLVISRYPQARGWGAGGALYKSIFELLNTFLDSLMQSLAQISFIFSSSVKKKEMAFLLFPELIQMAVFYPR